MSVESPAPAQSMDLDCDTPGDDDDDDEAKKDPPVTEPAPPPAIKREPEEHKVLPEPALLPTLGLDNKLVSRRITDFGDDLRLTPDQLRLIHFHRTDLATMKRTAGLALMSDVRTAVNQMNALDGLTGRVCSYQPSRMLTQEACAFLLADPDIVVSEGQMNKPSLPGQKKRAPARTPLRGVYSVFLRADCSDDWAFSGSTGFPELHKLIDINDSSTRYYDGRGACIIALARDKHEAGELMLYLMQQHVELRRDRNRIKRFAERLVEEIEMIPWVRSVVDW